jgi:lysyl-tRNA synthetase class 2
MIEFAQSLGYETANSTWEQLFNQWLLNEFEPKIGLLPTIVVDFPARISPLCSVKPNQPELAQRFEIYLNGIEVANGNQEKTDVQSIRQAFLNEKQVRLDQNLAVPPIDEEFLISLTKLKNQQVAGIGVGLERLWMILLGENQL